MPMFDFKCEDCKNIFEDLVLPNGDAISCPTCNSLNITKLIGACPALWMTFTPSMTAGNGKKSNGQTLWPYKIKTRDGNTEDKVFGN